MVSGEPDNFRRQCRKTKGPWKTWVSLVRHISSGHTTTTNIYCHYCKTWLSRGTSYLRHCRDACRKCPCGMVILYNVYVIYIVQYVITNYMYMYLSRKQVSTSVLINDWKYDQRIRYWTHGLKIQPNFVQQALAFDVFQ